MRGWLMREWSMREWTMRGWSMTGWLMKGWSKPGDRRSGLSHLLFDLQFSPWFRAVLCQTDVLFNTIFQKNYDFQDEDVINIPLEVSINYHIPERFYDIQSG